VGSETPEYLGRAVVALAGDADVMRHSGQVGARPVLRLTGGVACRQGIEGGLNANYTDSNTRPGQVACAGGARY